MTPNGLTGRHTTLRMDVEVDMQIDCDVLSDIANKNRLILKITS